MYCGKNHDINKLAVFFQQLSHRAALCLWRPSTETPACCSPTPAQETPPPAWWPRPSSSTRPASLCCPPISCQRAGLEAELSTCMWPATCSRVLLPRRRRTWPWPRRLSERVRLRLILLLLPKTLLTAVASAGLTSDRRVCWMMLRALGHGQDGTLFLHYFSN